MKYYLIWRVERARVNGVYYDEVHFYSQKTNDYKKIMQKRNVVFVKDLKTGEIIIDKR